MPNLFKSLGFLSEIWTMDFVEAIRTHGWNKIVDNFESAVAAEPPFSRMVFLLQSDMLEFLQLDEFSGCAFDFVPILRQAPAVQTPDEIREFMFENILRGLQYQIENGGPTHFLNVEKMTSTEAVVLVHEIIELRYRGIHDVIIPFLGETFFVEDLWLTYYGYQIMCALELKGLTFSLEEFERVSSALSEIGVEVNVREVTSEPTFSPPESLPPAMYKLILSIAKGNYREFRPFAFHSNFNRP